MTPDLLGLELAAVLEAATDALARLDAEMLCQLERRAVGLQASIASGARLAALPEIAARRRVFAGVVRATGENLGILERVGCGAYVAARTRSVDPWAL